jgi:hypothetical protein
MEADEGLLSRLVVAQAISPPILPEFCVTAVTKPSDL